VTVKMTLKVQQYSVHGDGGDSVDDFDFSDSDFDLEGDDDDIFVDYVDEDATEETGSKGQQKGKGKKAVGSKLKGTKVLSLAGYGEESTDESELELPESDEEGQGLRFKSFKSEDIDNPIFKVGMIFESVGMLRKAITQYSMKQRVEIKMPRNEKKRLKAHCGDGCLWNLYASSDSRTQGLMIKTYHGQHTCQRKWTLKRCTSKWLAHTYLESFQADQKMTLTNFARTVQKE